MRYGYFDNKNREYVVDRPDVSVSWTNYLGTEDTGTVISHNAGGYMFSGDPETHRITRFRPNGVPLDRPGHYVYIRDNSDGDYWSISWQPVGKDLKKASYRTRHGLSYSVFECDYKGIHASQKLFIPRGRKCEIWDVILRNDGTSERRLSLFGYCEFSFNIIEIDNQNFQMSMYCSGSRYADGVIECICLLLYCLHSAAVFLYAIITYDDVALLIGLVKFLFQLCISIKLLNIRE